MLSQPDQRPPSRLQDCGLLQQGCDIAHGAYLRPPLPLVAAGDGALLQLMLTAFLSDRPARFAADDRAATVPLLRLPRAEEVRPGPDRIKYEGRVGEPASTGKRRPRD